MQDKGSPVVIVVEDEADLRGMICGFLAMSGIAARGAADAAELDRAWTEQPADILVLDVNLPGEDGFSIAERMRRASPVGIIMMTARGSTDDRIGGREAGADSYLVKPVELRELLATIRALLRRLNTALPAPERAPDSWVLDRARWVLAPPRGIPMELTAAEFTVLDLLLSASGQTVAADAILERLGKNAADTNRRCLDELFQQLCRKVEREAGIPLPVQSVVSLGYVFAGTASCAEGSLTVNAAP